MDDVANQFSLDQITGKAQLEEMAEYGRHRTHKKQIIFRIGDRILIADVMDLVAKAADFVLWGKDLVDQAVRPSAEASLIWAGVCLVLPLLTYPRLASLANESGFNYVTARMNFYVALEPRLLPKRKDISEGKEGVQEDLISLYRHILEFQLRSVLRFHEHAVKRNMKDVRHHGDWEKMLSEVKEAEDTLDRDFKITNAADIKDALEAANQSLREMCNFVPVAEELLKVNKLQTTIQEKHLREVERTKYTLAYLQQIRFG